MQRNPSSYNERRLNGASSVHLPEYNEERDFRWTKGEKRADGYVYGAKRPDGYYDYELTYYPADDVLRVVEAIDRDYIARLKQEGSLLKTEPNLERDLAQYQEPRGGHRHHTFQDEIMQLLQQARDEVKQFGKELSEPERKAKQEEAERKSRGRTKAKKQKDNV